MSGARGSFGTTSVHIGTNGHVRCSAYPDELPILTVDAGDCTITITLAGRSEPGPHAVKFARELAAEATRFADECERVCAANRAGEPGTAAA